MCSNAGGREKKGKKKNSCNSEAAPETTEEETMRKTVGRWRGGKRRVFETFAVLLLSHFVVEL